MQEQEYVRITKSKYEEVLRVCRMVDEKTDMPSGGSALMRFADRENLPSIEEMKKRNIEKEIRELYPYFIYYRDVYEPRADNQAEAKALKAYFGEILSDWLDIIEDEDVLPIDQITSRQWKEMDLDKRCARFSALISYYSPYEFMTFLKDLGFKKFMSAYGIRGGQYMSCERLIDDLELIWEKEQGSP